MGMYAVSSCSKLPLTTYVSDEVMLEQQMDHWCGPEACTGFSWLEAEVDYRGCEVLQPQVRRCEPQD